MDILRYYGVFMLVRVKGFVEGSPVAEELEDVNITYQCLTQVCALGKTMSDGTGMIRLYTYRPEGCNSPMITAQKEGYLPAVKQATAETVDIFMTKLQRMNYTIMVHPYYEEASKNDPLTARNQQWLEAQTYTRLPKTMHATLSLSLRNGTLDQYKIYPANATQFAMQPEEASAVEGVERDELDLIYGDAQYDLDIILFKGDNPAGGYHAENITISYDDIATNNNMIFHVMEYRPTPDCNKKGDPGCAGMFMFLFERGKYDGEPYWKALMPTFTP